MFLSGRTGLFVASNGFDAYLMKLDSNGNLIWTDSIGTSERDVSYGLAVDHRGDVFMVGGTAGNFAAQSAGLGDAFLVKFTPVPEPSSCYLLAATLFLLSGLRRQSENIFC